MNKKDAHYIWSSFPRSVRYDVQNAYKLYNLYAVCTDLFKLAHEEEVNGKKILFTHAGLMDSWQDKYADVIGDLTVDNLNNLMNSKRGIECLGALSKYRTRLSVDKAGSILWSDVREKINDPKDAVVKPWDFQIFGHTQLIYKPIIFDEWACIDCRRAFVIDDEGNLKEYENEQPD